MGATASSASDHKGENDVALLNGCENDEADTLSADEIQTEAIGATNGEHMIDEQPAKVFAIRHDVSDKSNSLRLYELIIIYCYKTEWKHRINENEISSDPGTNIDTFRAV